MATEICGMGVSSVSQEDDLRLRIDQWSWRISVTPGDGTLAFIGWEVAGPQELESLATDLEAAGVAVHQPGLATERGVLDLISVQDPAGNQVEFFYGPSVTAKPFRSPQDVEFVTGEQGLGHVVLGSPNAEEMERFYLDVLGFRVSDRIDLGRVVALFTHINPRHHSLALVTAEERLFHHFMLQTANLDMVGAAIDRTLATGARPASSLGKHSNDHMVSFYLQTPSSCQIEYGWDGREPNIEPWTTVVYDGSSVWGHNRPY